MPSLNPLPASFANLFRPVAVRVMRRLFHWWFVLNRPMTLGVRAMVLDAQDRVLLVRHTYIAGWHMPGGGIETGEDALAAITRELEEEANIRLSGTPRWHGLFFNAHASMCRTAKLPKSAFLHATTCPRAHRKARSGVWTRCSAACRPIRAGPDTAI